MIRKKRKGLWEVITFQQKDQKNTVRKKRLVFQNSVCIIKFWALFWNFQFQYLSFIFFISFLFISFLQLDLLNSSFTIYLFTSTFISYHLWFMKSKIYSALWFLNKNVLVCSTQVYLFVPFILNCFIGILKKALEQKWISENVILVFIWVHRKNTKKNENI